MRLLWAILGGLLLGGAIGWWSTRESPEALREKQARAERAATADAEDARPVLYRWRDADGTLHVSDQPPKGREYERIDREPKPGIEVHGDRE
jgi:hypothetical protein